ncbi:MAG: flagellar basal body-associated FliL family protein [Spongiibacteraceae bacterium]
MRWVKWWVAMLVLAVSCTATASAKKESEAAPTSEYIALAPALVANYGGSGPIHYLKADVALRVTGGPAAQSAVLHHMPYVRHVLVMLLSDQTEESLATMEGKEKLRQDALGAVQKVMQEEEGKPLVDDLLFNSFIVQR